MDRNGLMSVAEAAAALGISRGLVARGIGSGALPIGVKIGDRYVIPEGAVERFLAGEIAGAGGQPASAEQIAREVMRARLRLDRAALDAQLAELARMDAEADRAARIERFGSESAKRREAA